MADDEFLLRYVPPPDPNLGRKVDVYFILRVLLGKGGMGAAYLAEHEALSHIKCVIKLVLAEMAHHPMVISRYKTEVHALAALKHDNIVKLQGFGVLDDGQLYLRFEYVEGKSLDRYLAEHGGRLPLRKAVYFVFQLCGALDHAHKRRVIHRDLKPDNLMIEFEPPGSLLKERIKLLDFGIAKVDSTAVDMTGSGMQMGTPAYMAPEQVTNAASVDGRADIFSLAQLFYRMVTGTLPWGTPESTAEIYHLQRTQAPASPSEDLMPREVAEIVARALSLKPDDRPTAHEFALELASRIKNGAELLGQVVPDWAVASHPEAPTLPRPAEPTPPAVRSPISNAAALVGSAEAQPLSIVALSPAAPPSGPGRDVTAHERPRALAAQSAPAMVAASPSPGVALQSPMPPPEAPAIPLFVPAAPRNPPTPVFAVLPTGLASQQFAAQELLVEQAQQAEVYSEIELATGTPGPSPYAHAELPAVLVSTTQLSGVSAAGALDELRLDRREPPPFVMLPNAPDAPQSRASSAGGKRVLLAAAACSIAAFAAFAVVRASARTTSADERGSGAITNDVAPPRTSVVAAALDAGIVDSSPARSVLIPRDSTGTAENRSSEIVANAPTSKIVSGNVAPVQMTGLPAASAPTHLPTTARAANPVPISSPGSGTNESAPKIRAPLSRTSSDSAVDVTLVIRVRGFAKVSVDGDDPVDSPRRTQVRPGAHHITMSGYPEGSDEKQIKEFDVAVPAGRPEFVISKTW